MFVSFHSKGTAPSFNDKLNTLASGILICSTVSISSFGGIPSTPGDLLSFCWICAHIGTNYLCTMQMRYDKGQWVYRVHENGKEHYKNSKKDFSSHCCVSTMSELPPSTVRDTGNNILVQ